jgi:hypothetical protein
MRKPKPKRIVTFEEFMRSPRTSLEVESHHVLLAELQHLGAVDADLNVIERSGAARYE